MRAYFFGNMYLSSIQQGIQAGHVIANMAARYWGLEHNEGEIFYDWAENHETMILLNGGYGENIHDLNAFFNVDENPYPYEMFCESTEALDGAITCTGIILPVKIYEGAKAMRQVKRDKRSKAYYDFDTVRSLILELDEPTMFKYTEWEVELMERLNTFRLAI